MCPGSRLTSGICNFACISKQSKISEKVEEKTEKNRYICAGKISLILLLKGAERGKNEKRIEIVFVADGNMYAFGYLCCVGVCRRQRFAKIGKL